MALGIGGSGSTGDLIDYFLEVRFHIFEEIGEQFDHVGMPMIRQGGEVLSNRLVNLSSDVIRNSRIHCAYVHCSNLPFLFGRAWRDIRPR